MSSPVTSSLSGVRTLVKILSNQKKGFNVCHINARSVRGKVGMLGELFCGSEVHALLVSETWLDDSINSKLVSLPGYELFRNDRSGRRGGGVAIFITGIFKSKVLHRSKPGDIFEYICIEVSTGFDKCVLVAVYCPPNSFDDIVIVNFHDALANILASYRNIIIGGDFNVNIILDNPNTRILKYMLLTLDLKVINSIPTYYNTQNPSQLDLFITAETDNVLLVNQINPPCDFDHDFIFVSYDIRIQVPLYHHTFSYRDFQNIDLDALYTECISLPWDNIFHNPDIDAKVDLFTELLTGLYERHVPIRTCNTRSKGCPWFSNEIRILIAERDLLFAYYKRSGAMVDRSRYKVVRNKVNTAVKLAKRRFYNARLSPDFSPKELWRNLSNLGLYGKDLPKCSLEPNSLNNYFANISTTAHDPLHYVASERASLAYSLDGFAFRCVDAIEMLTAIEKIKSNASGPDNLIPRFVKLILPYISHVLLHILNCCITTSKFPSLWKQAVVIPVPKSRTASELHEYRPISLLCFFGKVFERLLDTQIVQYLNRNNLLSCWQSGFRRHHSCETAMLNVVSNINEFLDRDDIVTLALLDFSKAFDTVNHDILLRKLYQHFKFSSSAIGLIGDFLQNRSQRVKVDQILSSSLTVNRGVPQGSILGPLLFSLYINDLPTVVKDAAIHLYADDVQLYLNSPIGLTEDCVVRLNDDLQRISEWSEQNCLSINPDKSVSMVIYKRVLDLAEFPSLLINNKVIPYVNSARSLGMVINRTCSCCDHISNVVGRVYGCLRQLRFSARFLSGYLRLKLAKALILPHLTFGSLVFSKLDSICLRKLNVAFNDTIRFIHGLPRYSHISPYINSFLGYTLETYLMHRRLKFLYSIIYNKQPSYLLHHIHFLQSTRRRDLLLPNFHSRFGERSYFVQVIRSWNALPPNCQRAGSLGAFSRLLASTHSL